MKKGKKLFALLLSLSLLLSLLPTVSLAADAGETLSGECGESCSYSLENGTLSISGSGEMDDYAAHTAPWSGATVTALSIAEGITGVGDFAFYDLSELTELTLPASLRSLGDYAFSGCTALQSVALSGVESLGVGVFSRCTALTELTVEETNPAFSAVDGVLYNKDLTTLVVFPAAGTGSFTLSESVTALAPYAFADSQLSELTLHSGLCELGEYAFSGCELESIALPSGVTVIPQGCFKGCTALSSVGIPRSVESVGKSAFESCLSLRSINYGGSLAEFYTLQNLAEVEYNEAFFAADALCGSLAEGEILSSGLCYVLSNDGTLTISGSGAMPDFDAPDSFVPVGYEFPAPWSQFRSSIEKLVIEEGVTTIGGYAFNDCVNLKTVVLPKSLRKLNTFCLAGCSSLEYIELPSGVEVIGDDAFYSCAGLKEIFLPGSLQTVGYSAFNYCAGLETVYFSGAGSQYGQICFKNMSANPMYYAENIYLLAGRQVGQERPVGQQDETLTVGSGSIQPYAFMNWNHLKKVSFLYGGNENQIGAYAFYGCKQLSEVELRGRTSIGAYAFCNTAISELSIGSEVYSIGEMAFGSENSSANPLTHLHFEGNAPAVEPFFAVGNSSFYLSYEKGATGFDAPEFASYTFRMSGLVNDKGVSEYGAGTKLRYNCDIPEGQCLWSVETDYPNYVKISESGVLSIDKKCPLTTVTVKANDANAPLSVYAATLTIHPAVTKIDLPKKTYIVYGADSVIAAYDVYPEDAIRRLEWKSGNSAVATVENGVITATGVAGTADIIATATDGSGKSAKLQLKCVQPVTDVSIESPQSAIVAGKSMSLKAVVSPSNAYDKSVYWDVSCPDTMKSYVTMVKGKLSVAKGCPAGTVTVTVRAPGAAQQVSRSMDIEVTEPIENMYLFVDAVPTANGYKQPAYLGENTTMQLGAVVAPMSAAQSVTWKSSNTKVATVDENGLVTILGKGGSSITATSTDGSKKTLKLNLNVTIPAESVSIQRTQLYLPANTNFTPKTEVLPKNAGNKKLTWSLECDEALRPYLSFNEKNGQVKLSRNYSGSGDTVTLTAIAQGSSREIVDSLTLTLVPAKLSAVTLLMNEQDVSGKRLNCFVGERVSLRAEANGESVVWKSSNEKVATVDENGSVTLLMKGSVTISATATDGSKKSAKLNLSVNQLF